MAIIDNNWVFVYQFNIFVTGEQLVFFGPD